MTRNIEMTSIPRPVNATEPVQIDMPANAEVVELATSGPDIVIWYDYDAEEEYTEQPDKYMVVPTGFTLSDEYSHVGTVIFGIPSNAVHLYKAKADAPVPIEPEEPSEPAEEMPLDLGTDPVPAEETDIGPPPEDGDTSGGTGDAGGEGEGGTPEGDSSGTSGGLDPDGTGAQGTEPEASPADPTEPDPEPPVTPAVPSQPPATSTPEE